VKHRVIILRVHRTLAGAFCAWDKLYFFREEARDLIPRVFSSCLILGINRPLVKMIRAVIDPLDKRHRPVPGKVFPVQRGDEGPLKEEMGEHPPMDEVLANKRKYLVVIPVLFHARKGDKDGKLESQSYPVYLGAGSPKPGVLRQQFKRQSRKSPNNPTASQLAAKNQKNLVHSAVHNNAAFYYRGEMIEPICGACSRSLFMLAGRCQFGEKACYDALASQTPSDFIKNMRTYQKYAREAAELEDSNVELREHQS
jgi:hypothetical protein